MAILLGLHLCRRAGIAPAWPPWPKIRRCVWKWSLGFVQKWGVNACAYIYIYTYNIIYVCVLYCLCTSLYIIIYVWTPILRCWNIHGEHVEKPMDFGVPYSRWLSWSPDRGSGTGLFRKGPWWTRHMSHHQTQLPRNVWNSQTIPLPFVNIGNL